MKNKVNKITLIITMLLSPILFAGVYKWTDANGKVHFSDRPHQNASQINIKATKPSGIGTSSNQLKRQKELLLKYQDERESRQKQQRKIDKINSRIAQQCKYLRDQILSYEEVDYLYTRDDEGQRENLTDYQKAEETERLQKQYAEKCS